MKTASLDHKTPLFCSGRVRADSCVSTKPACPGASPTLPESSMLSGKDAGSPLCALSLLAFARGHPVQDTHRRAETSSFIPSFVPSYLIVAYEEKNRGCFISLTFCSLLLSSLSHFCFFELHLLLSFPRWRRIILNASVKKQEHVKAGNWQISSGH